jgi:hypothetical protein
VSIRPEYRLHFDCNEGETSMQLSANEPVDDGKLAVWIDMPVNSKHRDELLLRLDRAEALELKAVLGVLTDTATPEEEAAVGVLS